MKYNSDFRYDLEIGQEYETLLSEVESVQRKLNGGCIGLAKHGVS